MSAVVWFATIEGVATADGLIRWCYPEAPDYADTDLYLPTLAEPPSGASGEWDLVENAVSIGRFRVLFRNEAKRILNFHRSRPAAVAALDGEIDDSQTSIPLRPGHTIQSGDVIYLDRETILATTVVADVITVAVRGHHSTADSHADGANVFDVPPALTGREVLVYETERYSGSSADEVLILRGQAAGEVSSGIHEYCGLDCIDRFTTRSINKSPKTLGFLHAATQGEGIHGRVVDWDQGLWVPRWGGLVTYTDGPLTMTAQGMLYFPTVGLVARAVITNSWCQLQPRPVVGSLGSLISENSIDETDVDGQEIPCQEVILSDVDVAGSPFGYTPDGGSFTPSDRPIHICLNLIMSKAGATNHAPGATNYDLGTVLAPDYSLGIPYAQVDVQAFERVDELLGPLRCRRLWIGVESETYEELFRRILGPFGFAVGVRRDGVWTIVGLGDVYPRTSTVALSGANITQAREIQHLVLARPLTQAIVHCDPDPKGDTRAVKTFVEIAGAKYYPEGVGADVEYKKAPYRFADLDAYVSDLVAVRFRRLADRVPCYELTVGGSDYDSVDLGTPVTVQEASIREPVDGLKDTQFPARVMSTDITRRPPTNKIRVAFQGTGKVGLISPAARVVSDDAAGTLTVEDRDFSRSDGTDVGKFQVGQYLVLCTRAGVPRSSTTGANTTRVLAVDSTTNELQITNDGSTLGRFKSGAGTLLTANAGDLVVFAQEDDVTASQRSVYAFLANGDKSAPAEFSSGRVAYVWGD